MRSKIFFILRPVLVTFALALTATATFVAIGLALGWILNWLVPGFGFDSAVISSMIAMFAVLYFGLQLFKGYAAVTGMTTELREENFEDDDDDDDMDLADWQVEEIAAKLSESMFSKMDQLKPETWKRRR